MILSALTAILIYPFKPDPAAELSETDFVIPFRTFSGCYAFL